MYTSLDLPEVDSISTGTKGTRDAKQTKVSDVSDHLTSRNRLDKVEFIS